MKITRTIITLCLSIFSFGSYSSPPVDTIITNANIYGEHQADTVATHNGVITFIGQRTDLEWVQSNSIEVVDLQGAYLMPGFIDNHNHVFEAASEMGGSCELSLDATLQEQIPYLIACQRYSKDNQWVIGYGFTLESLLSDNSQQTPLDVIDRLFPHQPIILMEQTSHSMWVNSVALELAGITKDTPDPQGGKILRDEQSGDLTGILLDNAGDQVMEIAWNSIENQQDLSYEGLMNGLEEATSHGITTIGDGRLYWKRGWYDVWMRAEKNNDLSARVSLRPWIYPADSMAPQIEFLKGIHSDDRTRLLLIDQVKMYSDGIFINGTAKTLAPYLDTYLPDSPYGINYIPPKQLESWLIELNSIGFSAHIHAIGDGAVRESLNGIEKVRKVGSNKVYTLTHVELIDPQDVERFASLDVTADFQVGSEYVALHEHQWAETFIGAVRARSLMNLKAISDTGANVTLSSDWNVNDINPLVGIANSLRMGSTGLPDIDTAIQAYTINAAKSLNIEDITGSIDVGKSADFVVLDKDITRLSPEAIARTQIIMTILRGDIVFDSQHY
ncbi:amidohydrolase [uncultured Vibrio sp.]|uniref:amidohydrolase n=1 Tax=uncultured Vibrio sp. TaxID=114054 RepID=UPI0025EFC182|nr:amidohydrolase [uncultured Vibrio sp.]